MNKQLVKLEFRCAECNAVFSSEAQLKEHAQTHNVIKISDSVFALLLPSNIKPGTFEAAEALAKAYDELKAMHPDKKLDFIPFDYKVNYNNSSSLNDIALMSVLVTVN